MTLSWAHADDSNILTLNQSGTAIAANASDAFVLLRELSVTDIKAHFRRFHTELRHALLDAHAMTSVELSEWCGSEKYAFPVEICPPWCCIAFKKDVPDGRKLPWMRHEVVVRALMDNCILPVTTPSGRQRTNTVRGTGGIANVLQALSLKDQRAVLKEIFTAYNLDLDDITRLLGQSSVIGLRDVESALVLDDFPTVMNRLVELTEASLFAQTASARGLNKRMGRGDGRRYAAPWFMAYLAREGALLWPAILPDKGKLLFPRVLKPFLWTLFCPRENAALGLVLGESAKSSKAGEYTLPVLRHLLLTTNFLHLSKFDLAHFLHLKSAFGPADGNSHFGHGVNLLLRETLHHYGLTYEDLGEDAGFFGGGRRLNAEHGREPFGWIERPTEQKPRLCESLLRKPAPKHFPEYLHWWSKELRTLLPAFGVSDIKQKVNALSHWLVYLYEVGEKYAPKSWEEINRQQHINSGGNAAYRTFLDFVRQHENVRANHYISTLRQAWELAATQHGFAGTISCPIDHKIDRVKSEATRAKHARTRRLPLDADLLMKLIDENRRDDFAFAKDLNLYDREVVDSVDGVTKTVFWPALPTMLDLILNSGMRKGSSQWSDSGEGDELWAEPEAENWIENRLPTATVGRQAGFLQFVDIGPSKRVLGMFLGVTKTGPYSVPWVDETSAQLFVKMRDWQARYNARRTPVVATRDSMRKQYSDEGAIPAVYPVFRDPRSRQGYPPTDQTFYDYWRALLKHCENIVNSERKAYAEEHGTPYEEESFFDSNGKPLWDIHSLRVTTVSTLLDAGVPISIIAELLGHQSVAMTWYYNPIDSALTHEALLRGMEARRLQAIERLRHLGPNHEIVEEIDSALGGIVLIRRDAKIPADLLGEIFSSKERFALDFYADGICIGDCSTGGELFSGSYLPVFRPRACSRCRHRITGPAFINGLVLRLNCLMVEIKESIETETRLNAEIEKAEDAGSPTVVLEGLVKRNRELCDNLWAEWCAELTTIKKCEALMAATDNPDNLPMMTPLGVEELEMRFQTVHDLALLQQIVSEGELISGASMTVPASVREQRDARLLEIAAKNNLGHFFYQCTPEVRSRALSAFGMLLLRHAPEMSEEAVLYFDHLLDGSLTIASQSELETDVTALVTAFEKVAISEGEE